MSIQFWIETHDLKSRVKAHIERMTSGFESRKEDVLGEELAESGFPMEKLIEHYWSFCKKNPILKFAVETAVSNTKQIQKIDWAKKFVRHSVISTFGYMIKYRTWDRK